MKVKFNLPTKRYNSKFSNDFNSTFDFGYIQSSLTKFVVPKSKFSINVSQLVRTAPLVVPTFGRMAVHNLFTYVPMSLIFPAFDAFISQTSVNGALKTYKPNSVPSITNNMLVCMLLTLLEGIDDVIPSFHRDKRTFACRQHPCCSTQVLCLLCNFSCCCKQRG